MNKKLTGIFVYILLFATTLQAAGISNVRENALDDIRIAEFVPGELIVKFKNANIPCHSINKLNEKHNVYSMKNIFKNREETTLENIYILGVPADTDILSSIQEYSSCPDVEYAEPNYHVQLCGIPNDNDFDKQWNLYNTGQTGGTEDADIDAPEAWDNETGDPDIIIAVLDLGVDYTHPDLADNLWVNEDEIPDNGEDDDENGYVDDVRGWDFGNNDNDPKDEYGHGTFCTGVAGAVTDNGIGIAGVGWNCTIMPLLVLGPHGGVTGILKGIEYAVANGARVISMSFTTTTHMQVLEDAINYAASSGVITVAAAGNSGESQERYPAAQDNVIAVAGTDHNDEKMNFFDEHYEEWIISNYGDWVDVAAPAVNIYSTMPTYHVTMNDDGYQQDYDYGTGSSYACPLVAGVAGLILSKNPYLSPEEIKTIICENVDPYISDVYIGSGRVNANKALNSVNSPPEKPNKPVGPSSGMPGEEYIFSSSTTDAEGEQIFFWFDWDDGTDTGWIGPCNSGETCEAHHSWQEKDNYHIRVKAKDINDYESKWSDPVPMSIPKNRNSIHIQFLLCFLEKHPHLFSIVYQGLQPLTS
jgi:subtilisin family serine protease